MEVVAAKTALLGTGGFFFGGGFALFKAIDDWRRSGVQPTLLSAEQAAMPATPMRTGKFWLTAAFFDATAPVPPSNSQRVLFAACSAAPPLLRATAVAAVEGARTARALALGTLVAGAVGLCRHGAQRYELVFDVRHDPAGAADGVAAGAYAALARGPPRLARATASTAAGGLFFAAAKLAAWGGGAAGFGDG